MLINQVLCDIFTTKSKKEQQKQVKTNNFRKI